MCVCIHNVPTLSPPLPPQVLHMQLLAEPPALHFTPPFSELEAIVQRLVEAIVSAGEGLPRVEHVLFPDLKGFELAISSVQSEEVVVLSARERALQLLKANTAGPHK